MRLWDEITRMVAHEQNVRGTSHVGAQPSFASSAD